MVGKKERMGSVGRPRVADTCEAVLRRLGFIVLTVHREVMAALIQEKKAKQAEELNDWMKPLGDMLCNYRFPGEDDDVTPEV